MVYPSKLTTRQRQALEYYHLDYAESVEPGAGWFAYTTWSTVMGGVVYPGSSCECIEDVERWYVAAAEGDSHD